MDRCWRPSLAASVALSVGLVASFVGAGSWSFAAVAPSPSGGRVAFVEDAPPSPITVVWIEPAADVGRLRLALVDPDLFAEPSLSIELYAGDPTGDAVRVVASREGGSFVAVAQSGKVPDLDSWIDQGAATVSLGPDGTIEIDRPRGGAGGASEVIWAVVSRDKGDARESATTPLFAAVDLAASAGPDARSAPTAWRYEAGVPVGAAALPPGPTMTLSDSELRWRFAGPVPSTLGAEPVATVEDVARFRLLGNVDRRATFEVTLSEGDATVKVVNSAGEQVPIPTSVAGTTTPLVSGTTVAGSTGRVNELPLEGAVEKGATLVVPRAQIEAAFGAPITSLSLLSLTRRVTLENGSVVALSGVSRSVREIIDRDSGAPQGTVAPAGPPTGGPGTTSTTIDFEAEVRAEAEQARRQSLMILLLVGLPAMAVVGWWLWRWAVDSPFGDAVRARRQLQQRREEVERELGIEPTATRRRRRDP